MDYRDKNAEIYGKVFESGRWSPDLLISRAAPDADRLQARSMTPNQILWSKPVGLYSEYTHIIRASDGTIVAVWQESVNGTPQRVMARVF
jgi:hypothetical protein